MIFKILSAAISLFIFIAVFLFSYWMIWAKILPETLVWFDTIFSGAMIIGTIGFLAGAIRGAAYYYIKRHKYVR